MRNCNKFSIAAGNETFSHVSARIWNALTYKINVNTSISKFKILWKSFKGYYFAIEIYKIDFSF